MKRNSDFCWTEQSVLWSRNGDKDAIIVELKGLDYWEAGWTSSIQAVLLLELVEWKRKVNKSVR